MSNWKNRIHCFMFYLAYPKTLELQLLSTAHLYNIEYFKLVNIHCKYLCNICVIFVRYESGSDSVSIAFRFFAFDISLFCLRRLHLRWKKEDKEREGRKNN